MSNTEEVEAVKGLMRALFLSFIVAALGVSVSAQEVLQKPTLEKGATYRYQSVDLMKNEVTEIMEHTVLTMLDDDNAVVLVSRNGGSPVKRRFDVANHMFFRRDRKGTFEAMRFPIAVGDTWQYEYTDPWNRTPGEMITMTFSAKFAGWEDVTVPAGTFRSAKIEHYGFWKLQSGAQGKEDLIFWYSPEVKRIVKERQVAYESWGPPIYHFETVLTKYEKAPSASTSPVVSQ